MKSAKMVSPFSTDFVDVPSLMVVFFTAVRRTPKAGVERRNLQHGKFTSKWVSGRAVTYPSRAYFLSFSNASGSSDCARLRIAGQWTAYLSER
jgi:hypothetical protein